MSKLVSFYRAEDTDSRGRTLADLWGFSVDELEAVHDFIQWMFPLREPSAYNPNAPLLTSADIAAFRSDPVLRTNLRRSFEVFLAFVGLRYRDGEVVDGPDFEEKRNIWRYPNHNWLRITRVLISTRTLDLEVESAAFFRYLSELKRSGRGEITDETFRYWSSAATGRSH
jgi:hypothetical protein